LAAIAVASALAGCAHAPTPEGVARSWQLARGPHVAVWAEEDPAPSAHEVEVVYAALTTIFPGVELPPLDLLVFQDQVRRDEVLRAAAALPPPPAPGPPARPVVALWRRGLHRERIVSNPLASPIEEQAARALTERFVDRAWPHAPAWLREGFARYAETVHVDGDVALFGARIAWLRDPLARGEVVPLAELVAMDRRELHRDWPRMREASAWAFVHFLLDGDGGRWRPRFAALCARLETAGPGASGRAILEATFPELTFAELDAAYRAFAVDQLGRRPIAPQLAVSVPAGAPAIERLPVDPAALVALLQTLTPRPPRARR
jgi:hypothetical protein